MATLLERILQGESEAVIEFYQQHSGKLAKYLRNRLPAKEDAEEILNDIFLEAVDELPLLPNCSNITAWLFAIARNKVADFYRKRKIKQILLSQAPYLEIIANEIEQPEFQFEKNKVRDRIEKAFKSLSVQYQNILELHYEVGIPVREIAPIINLSFKATESLLFRARRQFRIAYGNE